MNQILKFRRSLKKQIKKYRQKFIVKVNLEINSENDVQQTMRDMREGSPGRQEEGPSKVVHRGPLSRYLSNPWLNSLSFL